MALAVGALRAPHGARTATSCSALRGPLLRRQSPNVHPKLTPRLGRAAVVCLAQPRRAHQVMVSLPPVQQPPPSVAPRARPLSWTFVSTLLVIAVGALQLSRQLMSKYLEMGEFEEEIAQSRAAAAATADAAAEAAREEAESARRALERAAAAPAAPEAEAAVATAEEEQRQAEAAAAAAAAAAAEVAAAAEAAREAEAAAAEEAARQAQAAAALEDFAPAIREARLAVQGLDLQLLELQNAVSAALPPQVRLAAEGVTARIEALEEQLSFTGAEAAAGGEQQFESLQWELFNVVAPHASEEQAGAYRTLLGSLCLQRQLLATLEARQAVLQRMQSVQEVQQAAAAAAASLIAEREEATTAAVAEEEQQQRAAVMQQWEQAAASWAGLVEEQEVRAPEGHAPALNGSRPHADSSSSSSNGAGAGAAVAEPPAAGAAVGVPRLRLVSAGVSLPHPDKVETGGEDAFFVSQDGLGAVGVADGVGGWALEGIDPAQYPRELLAACEDGLAHHEEPLSILMHAHERAHAPGSCTVCLATMGAEGRLRLASLGDCGAAVVREGQGVIFRAEVQEYKFNMPYQMASPRFLPGSNHPMESRLYDLEVQPGDVVVIGSDGLFDNLWESDMLGLVHTHLQNVRATDPEALEGAAHKLAAELAQRAHTHSQDPDYRSPFAVERHERLLNPIMQRLTRPTGGKMDDVTAVVGVVCF